jgi:hypothetical protein
MKLLLQWLVLSLGLVAAQSGLADDKWHRYFPRGGICVDLWQPLVLRKEEMKKSPAQLFYGIFKIPVPDSLPEKLPATPAEIADFLNAGYSGHVTLEPLTDMFRKALQQEETFKDVSAEEQARLLQNLENSAYLLSGNYRPSNAVDDTIELEKLGLVLVTRQVCEWAHSE